MKRTLISALPTSAGLSAATVSGSIFDPSGAAIPDAKVLVLNPDTGTKQEAVTGADGKFSVSDTPAGEYILRVEKPGFASILQEFNLQDDSKIDREFTMNVGHVQQEVRVAAKGSPVESFVPGMPKRVRIGGQVAQANLISKKQPVYPSAAKADGVQGTVELETVISREGAPLEIRVIRSPSDDLSESALEAVRQWRYKPTLLNGNPIEIVTDVIVNYTLAP
ncbi:MAG: TonB family protein [Acidobacteriota bacterium]|nr:TonB family protein [Acidobacteriota bacterium]MDQ2840078.1 TonB family protein [Acidobacteriota bacterium]